MSRPRAGIGWNNASSRQNGEALPNPALLGGPPCACSHASTRHARLGSRFPCRALYCACTNYFPSPAASAEGATNADPERAVPAPDVRDLSRTPQRGAPTPEPRSPKAGGCAPDPTTAAGQIAAGRSTVET